MRETAVAEALACVRSMLRRAGVDDPRLDARVLVAHVLGCDKARLRGFPEQRLTDVQRDNLRSLATKRAGRMPMAQVLGTWEFWSLDLRVTPDTLTPRPDSEAIVACCLDLAAAHGAPSRIVDLGTGSGCLIVSLLLAWPRCRGLGVDCSEAALAVARDNARSHGLEGRARFERGDWLAGVDGSFDLVVANPPYVPSGDIAGLDPEVARHEPRLALDGGRDGLDCYRAILPGVASRLAPGGFVVLEHGEGQGPGLECLASSSGLEAVSVATDLSGRRRGLALRPRGGADREKTAWKPVKR